MFVPDAGGDFLEVFTRKHVHDVLSYLGPVIVKGTRIFSAAGGESQHATAKKILPLQGFDDLQNIQFLGGFGESDTPGDTSGGDQKPGLGQIL